jgi:hypothetical protein
LSDDKLTVRSFRSETEAHLARTKLATMGIEGTVHRFSRYRAVAAGGYVLKVSHVHLKRAQAILSKLDTEVDMDEYVSADDDSYVRCPKCRSVNITTEPLPGKVLGLSLVLLGIPLLFLKKDRQCRKCGYAWRK